MTNPVLIKNYSAVPLNISEVLRYARCCQSEVPELLKECLSELEGRLSYKVCYRIIDVFGEDDPLRLPAHSETLSKHLAGCQKAVLFAATIGFDIDRLIMKYGQISPAKALYFQAIGAERIESLCDTFSRDIQESLTSDNLYLRPRFSPGYGDLPLELQRSIFALLNCPKNIGLTLGDSLIMSPSKSVTALMGISSEPGHEHGHKCGGCENTSCKYRG